MKRGPSREFTLRGSSEDTFPPHKVTLREVHPVGRVAWEKWGPLIADHPLRDLIALVYAEGLYHGYMLGQYVPELRIDTLTEPEYWSG